MIIAFNGDVNRLNKLYKELGLATTVANDLVALSDFVKTNDEKTVITNFNELMAPDVMTADITEKKAALFKSLKGYKKNLFIQVTKIDNDLDRLTPDVIICTKMETEDMAILQYVFYQIKTDLPYNGKLEENKFVIKELSNAEFSVGTLSDIKKIIG